LTPPTLSETRFINNYRPPLADKGGITETSPVPRTTYPLRPSGSRTSMVAHSFRYRILRTGNLVPLSSVVSTAPRHPPSFPVPANIGVGAFTMTVCLLSSRTSLTQSTNSSAANATTGTASPARNTRGFFMCGRVAARS